MKSKKIKVKPIKVDPFKVSTGKCPVRQRPGAGAHNKIKDKKLKRAQRKRPTEDD